MHPYGCTRNAVCSITEKPCIELFEVIAELRLFATFVGQFAEDMGGLLC